MNANLEIKRIDLWSLFKLSFIIYAVIGVIVGFIYMVFFMLLGSINSTIFADEIPNFSVLGGGLIGLLIIPFFAFLNGIFGSVITTIGGGVYNLIAGMAGGLKVHASEIVEVRAAPYAPPTPPVHGTGPGDQAHAGGAAETHGSSDPGSSPPYNI